MSTEPMDDPTDLTDPASLPLFAATPLRPGRVRGGFSMRPPEGLAVLDEARRRREAAHRDQPREAGQLPPIDWELVRAFLSLIHI